MLALFLKVKNCISLDSLPILDIDYLAGEHEGAEAAGSTEPSKYCSASTRHVPDVAQALWAWLVDGQLPEIPNVWVEEQGSPPHPLTRVSVGSDFSTKQNSISRSSRAPHVLPGDPVLFATLGEVDLGRREYFMEELWLLSPDDSSIKKKKKKRRKGKNNYFSASNLSSK